ncbi:MAG: Transglycosylase domain protein [Frankiales bacterium]|nr:Transglycosylase domain protein [Frankiales bacterium]MCW2586999.1 Transglycosylase domain protein [Frankiales bacterium]
MSLLRARKPRHAKPSKTAPALAAGGLTATFGAALATPASAAAEDDFARLRMCESGGNYAINTGNGYYGAYQFDLRTWRGLGYTGKPSDARPATQDAAAQRLQAARGWQPWPACARRLGLGDDRVEAARASRSHRVTIAKASRPTATPAFAGTALTTKLVKQTRDDVRAWQARMAARGWDIKVDGRYGPKSAHVAARFAAEKGLKTTPGVVDQKVWNAAWQLRVS